MFNTFFVFQFRSDLRLAAIDANAYYGFNIVSNVISLLLSWDFYRLDVREFAKLSTDEMEIDWKTFLFTPSLFLILYTAFSSSFDSITNVAVIYTGSAFSIVIGILFIWAFYVIIKNMQATYAVKTLSVEVMEALAHTIDAKDEYTKGHSVRVAKYSRMLAEKLGLSPKDCESVYYMALLHDIGKIGVPNSIINSKTRLTDEEFAVIKKHPGLGYDILSEIKSRPDLSTGARWHHERFDGKGYPDKKSGEEIPYFARIIAVADSYDAMTSNRSYRGYLSQEAVRLEIEKNSGTQFDRDVARCMLDVIDEDKEYKLHE
ncbi:MAG: HD-GYP domain-containing protein [Lachnospiraceae bacterium]|nr:HD-GYP domain-containing protein [Lachnospiraceae bacterium]